MPPLTATEPLRTAWRTCLGLAALSAWLAAGAAQPPDRVAQATASGQPNDEPATFQVLMMGNSHTLSHNLPAILDALLRAAKPAVAVSTVVAPGSMFLEERWRDPATLALLESRRWDVVVLQAQKYSMSGTARYSTREAQALVRKVRAAGSVAVLFPEWPRRGEHETARILALHQSIAAKAQLAPACVAPVGPAWDAALRRQPALPLYAPDGNHADAAGTLLTALVLFGSLTGLSPLTAPEVQPLDVPGERQMLLRQVAADTLAGVARCE